MNCPYPIWVAPSGVSVQVPCGKCLICLENKRNEWAFRLEREARSCKITRFVTLTYHDGVLPAAGVSKRHVQLWLKRLRKRLGERMRYYLVGEYGSKHGRPHYHALLFNCGDDAAVRSAWTYRGRSLGIVDVRPVSTGRIRYITKYVIQRVDHVGDRRKPFALMSRAYGIGGMYLTDEMVAWHRSGMKNYAMDCAVRVRLPRFYKDKIWWRLWKSNRYELLVHPDRKAVSEASKVLLEKSTEENRKILADAGYDPELIQAEMRLAAMERIRVKVAYSQIM